MQLSRERRKRTILDMNPKFSDLAEKDAIYEDAAPELFSDKFAKEVKECEEQLRCLELVEPWDEEKVIIFSTATL